MCTILLAWRCLDDARYVLAANRDEMLSRPAAPPRRLCPSPPVFGGRDLLAGGTWLAVTARGRLAAVTNRRGAGDEAIRDPRRVSRGTIPLRILRAAGTGEALARIRPADHNPFNLLVIDADAAIAGHGDGHATSMPVVTLAPGPHVLCVHDVDDTSHAKEQRLGERLREVLAGRRSAAAVAEAMVEILRSHISDGAARDAACVHDGEYGTVSASLVGLDAAGGLLYRHAQGHPCTTAFLDVALA